MKTSSLVQTPVTHDVDASLGFYRNLGFHQLDSDPARFTDGKVLIELNPDRVARTALRLFGDRETISEKLKEQVAVTESEKGLFCSDPNGVHLYLEGETEFELPEDVGAALGNFAGMSIETTDFSRTLQFWESLGYRKGCGDEAQGWLTLECEGWIGISIMKAGVCPHLFFSPGLTYFNSGKNAENIARIREAGVEITEEISCFNPDGIVDNVILRDPGGTGFFIFND